MRLTLTIFIVLLFLQACSEKTHHKIMQAEELMSTAPDSALILLQELLSDYNDMSEKDKAKFGLLYFQALDKNDLALYPIEIINRSISYYEQHTRRNKANLSACYLYKSRIYQANQQYSEATALLLKALNLVKTDKHHSLLGKIYYDLGLICYLQEEYEKSEKNYLLSIDCFDLADESYNQACSQIALANVYLDLKKNDIALDYQKNAFQITTDSLFRGIILLNISELYVYNQEYDSALYYLQQSFDYPCFSANISMRFYTLANLYFKLNDYDEAIKYALQGVEDPSNYHIQRECYRILANSEYIQDNRSEKMLQYMAKYQDYSDSIKIQESQPKVQQIEELYYANERIEKSSYSQIVLFGVICIIVLFSGGTLFWLFNKNKEKQQRADTYQHELTVTQTHLREELLNELEKARSIYAEKRKALLTMDERLRLDKVMYNEVLKIDNSDMFLEKMNYTFNNFPYYLQTHFPSVSYKEIVFCCLQLLDFSNMDMAYLLDFKQVSLYKLKQRLISKMNLKSAKEFDAFLIEKSTLRGDI